MRVKKPKPKPHPFLHDDIGVDAAVAANYMIDDWLERMAAQS